MNLTQNVSLKQYSTMRLGGTAAYVAEVTTRHELREAVLWAKQNQLPSIVIGSGSNIIWRDEGFGGLIIVNKIMGYEEQAVDAENFYLHIGAGELWDEVVARATAKGMTGIEALSLIPGTTGATPVQNVGAYGQEIADTLVSVEAYDSQKDEFITIPAFECDFGYRTSRFKTTDRGRFYISGLTLHLLHGSPKPPFYRALQTYFESRDIKNPTPQMTRDAVMAIRHSKLPDPAEVANNGSFFANPIVDTGFFTQLAADYPDMPHWPMEDGKIKIPAAWLIEQAGFKDFHDPETGMATWHAQPLVLINEKASSTSQLLAFRQKIVDTIKSKYGITLVQEPELLP